MNTAQMEKFTAHCDRYFEQTNAMVLHPTSQDPVHIDVLKYEPNEKYPFWKLVTMGASDYKMPGAKGQLGDRNEYMMAVDAEIDLNDPQVYSWYFKILMTIAAAPITGKYFMGYGHGIDWPAEADSDMVGAYITMPQFVENVGFLRCKLGLMKQAICLQAVPLTQEEMDKLAEIGPEAFDEFLYPEEGACHFLCERNRSQKF